LQIAWNHFYNILNNFSKMAAKKLQNAEFIKYLAKMLEKEHIASQQKRSIEFGKMKKLFLELFEHNQQKILSQIGALQCRQFELINDSLSKPSGQHNMEQLHALQQQQLAHMQELHNGQNARYEAIHYQWARFQKESSQHHKNHEFRLGFLEKYYLNDFNTQFQEQLQNLESERQSLKEQSKWPHISQLIDKCYDERSAQLVNNIESLKKLQAKSLQELHDHDANALLEPIMSRHIMLHGDLCAMQQRETYELHATQDQRELADIGVLSFLL
jgi:hypothetical protein